MPMDNCLRPFFFCKPGYNSFQLLQNRGTSSEYFPYTPLLANMEKLVILVLNITFLPACLSIRDGHFREFLGPKRQSASSKPHNFTSKTKLDKKLQANTPAKFTTSKRRAYRCNPIGQTPVYQRLLSCIQQVS